MNEELRSAAEELETSKEELQSVNEELTTVNQELKVKVDELASTNNDLRNLISATDLAAIFLDRSFRVKMSTPAVQRIFNLLPTDTGRKLTDITHHLAYTRLEEDVTTVLQQLHTIEREVQTRDGRCFLMRLLPYRTSDDRIDGVAITLLDISARVDAERRARTDEQRLRLLIDSASEYAILTMDQQARIDSWNAGAQRLFGYTAEDIIGKPSAVLFTPEDRAAGIPERELERAARQGVSEDERWHLRKDGSRFYTSGITTCLGEGATLGFAKIARDLTAQRDHARALKQAHEDLEKRVSRRTSELEAEVARRTDAQTHVRRLLARLITAQEDERARIARDLHDELGQQITALRLTLERVRRSAAPPPAVEEIDRALELAEKVNRAVDFLAWELRPAALDHLGLAAALPKFVQEWSVHYGIEAKTHTVGHLGGQLAQDAEITFYRVAQEALNNVAKHAHAGRVDVLLENRGESLVLVIEDDGVGFEVGSSSLEDRGLGLAGMQERAALVGATLHIESTPGVGTSVFLRCSLPNAEPQDQP
jgi:two-component system CheB/CheR fusion protein